MKDPFSFFCHAFSLRVLPVSECVRGGSFWGDAWSGVWLVWLLVWLLALWRLLPLKLAAGAGG